MFRALLSALSLLFVLSGCAIDRQPAAAAGGTDRPQAAVLGGVALPKLILVVYVDGLPQEQLTRNHDLFVPNGFRRLMDRGAWFSDAHQAHAFTVTAIGHASVMTGAHPYQTGIIGNEWRTRDGKYVYAAIQAKGLSLPTTPTSRCCCTATAG